MTSDHRSLPQRILDWLRAGYPEGIPPTDHLALLGVLHRSLSDTEVRQVADLLAAGTDSLLSRGQVEQALRTHALQQPSPADVERVTARLVDAGIRIVRDSAAPPDKG